MKTKITLLFAAICLLLSSMASAQLSVGGSLGYDKYGGDADISFINIGVNGEYAFKDDMGGRFGFTYCIPKTQDEEWYGSALSSTTSPSSITVTGESSISVMKFSADLKKYWLGGDYDDGGMYGLVGIGLSLASESSTVGSYDATKYSIGQSGESSSTSQLYIRLHLGYDIKLDALSIFIEPGIDLAANSANGQEVEVTIPTYLTINAGVRLPLGN